MRTAIALALLLLSGTAGAADLNPSLGTVNEGSFRQLLMVLNDKAGQPSNPEQVDYWIQTKGFGTFPTLVHTGSPIIAPGTNQILLTLSEDANRIIDNDLPDERRVVVVRVLINGQYQTFFPEYDVHNQQGFGVVNGVLVPTP